MRAAIYSQMMSCTVDLALMFSAGVPVTAHAAVLMTNSCAQGPSDVNLTASYGLGLLTEAVTILCEN